MFVFLIDLNIKTILAAMNTFIKNHLWKSVCPFMLA